MFHESNVVELKSKLIDEVKNEIIAFMHQEQAYLKTGLREVISFQYAENLQI